MKLTKDNLTGEKRLFHMHMVRHGRRWGEVTHRNEMKIPREVVGFQRRVYHSHKGQCICREATIQRRRVSVCEKVNMWEKLMEEKGYFHKFCLCRFKSELPPVVTVVSSSWHRRGEA